MSSADAKFDLNKILAGAQLPALPQSAIRLLELSQDPENGPPEFTVPIESDPGLTGQVLKFVNSSYFGFSREISSVNLAITLVGIRTIKNFALWSAVFSLMPNPKCGPFDLRSLWQDSLRRGLFSRAVGKAIKLPEAEDLFAAALLQDMAIPLLAKELPEHYLEMFGARESGRVRLSDLEDQQFGWNHAQAAGIMARGWSLPETFSTFLETHTRYDELAASPDAKMGQVVVALSAMLPSCQDPTWVDRNLLVSNFESIPGTESSDLRDLLHEVDQQYEEIAPVLKLTVLDKTLIHCLDEAQESAVR